MEFDKIAYISWVFVLVGEAFLFLFNASKVHKKIIKRITNWHGCVLLDLKNPIWLIALKKVERNFRNWPPKFASSMASLHKNGFKLHKLIIILLI
jgi:hypothetical protein